MKPVTVYSADWCPYCTRAKSLLKDKGVPFTEINVDQHPGKREEITKKTGMKTIPQIFIGDHFVGGFTDLAALESKGELDTLLQS
jgi:glutaredoxin 3